MMNDIVRHCIEQGYQDFIKRSFMTAAENALLGEPNAAARFKNAVEVVTKLRDELISSN